MPVQRRQRKLTPEEITKRVRSVDDIASTRAKVLIYSDNKVGKTTFAATAPKCIIVDVNEEGTRSIAGKQTGAQYIGVTEFMEIPEVYWWIKKRHKRYESCGVDTVTAMVHLAMKQALAERSKRSGDTIQYPDQRAWGRVKELMMPQILNFRNLPMHVVFTAQEKRWMDDDGDLEAIVPDIQGASLGITMGAVGVVGHLSKARPKRRQDRRNPWPRRLLVGDHEIIKAGNRVDLPRVLTNPTMADIIAAYQGV